MVVPDVDDRTPAVRMQAELCHVRAEVFRLAQELRVSRKMETFARAASAAVHDVNNLLAAIVALIGLSRTSKSHDTLAKNLDEMNMAAHRCAELLRGLSASKRQLTAHPRSIDLNHIVEKMAHILQLAAGGNARFSFSSVAPLGLIEADPDHVEQILMHLVVNARDSMPRGGNITIKTDRIELNSLETGRDPFAPAEEYVRLCVTDTGHGMNHDILCQIFQPFFTTKAPGRGRGLGLSIVSSLVQQNQGQIRVYSKPGEGSRFEVYFPLVRTTKQFLTQEEMVEL